MRLRARRGARDQAGCNDQEERGAAGAGTLEQWTALARGEPGRDGEVPMRHCGDRGAGGACCAPGTVPVIDQKKLKPTITGMNFEASSFVNTCMYRDSTNMFARPIMNCKPRPPFTPARVDDSSSLAPPLPPLTS